MEIDQNIFLDKQTGGMVRSEVKSSGRMGDGKGGSKL
jgi:hypothetical protein